MAFGTYTVAWHGQFDDGMKMLLGSVTAAGGDTAFTTDLSAYFGKSILQGWVWTSGAAFNGLTAIDVTTTTTTLAATLAGIGGAGGIVYYMAVGH